MPEHRIRTEPAAAERLEQPDLEREERGLGELGEMQAGFCGTGLQLPDDREPRRAAHQRIDLLDCAPENRILSEEEASHPRPLGTVPGEHEGNPRGPPDHLPGDDVVAPAFGGEGFQAAGELHRVATEDGEAVVVVLAPPGGAAGYFSRGGGTRGEEKVAVARGKLRQRAGAPGGEEEGKRPSAARGARARLRCTVLSQHDVGVGPAEAEGVDSERRRGPVGR